MGGTAPRQGVAGIGGVAVGALLDGPRSIPSGRAFGLDVEHVRGSVYYPPIGVLARPLARLDRWFGTITTVGAAFIALAARKPATDTPGHQQPPAGVRERS